MKSIASWSDINQATALIRNPNADLGARLEMLGAMKYTKSTCEGHEEILKALWRLSACDECETIRTAARETLILQQNLIISAFSKPPAEK
ncbi:hypothetical protein H0O02_04920 [Candidatus Micrarchaeota archaeon]|nr:hypothetical protein [Candidatus Micrarchaeota archaeon]